MWEERTIRGSGLGLDRGVVWRFQSDFLVGRMFFGEEKECTVGQLCFCPRPALERAGQVLRCTLSCPTGQPIARDVPMPWRKGREKEKMSS